MKEVRKHMFKQCCNWTAEHINNLAHVQNNKYQRWISTRRLRNHRRFPGAVYLFTLSRLIAGNIYHFYRTKEALFGTK